MLYIKIKYKNHSMNLKILAFFAGIFIYISFLKIKRNEILNSKFHFLKLCYTYFNPFLSSLIGWILNQNYSKLNLKFKFSSLIKI